PVAVYRGHPEQSTAFSSARPSHFSPHSPLPPAPLPALTVQAASPPSRSPPFDTKSGPESGSHREPKTQSAPATADSRPKSQDAESPGPHSAPPTPPLLVTAPQGSLSPRSAEKPRRSAGVPWDGRESRRPTLPRKGAPPAPRSAP